jgi:NTP pyrophosphatase (non-canonical NTP hydrolase)
MSNVFAGIRTWADNKGLISDSTWEKQFVKFEEESLEAMTAMMGGDLDQIKDELGDCAVVLTIMAAQHGLNLEDCLEHCLAKISKRKGTVVDGVFVKEAY